ncbi:MAG TPA: hypothetical protein VFI29_10630 [Hanamia sp.]|nr:hypothetical protein [Hanamia sp.]
MEALREWLIPYIISNIVFVLSIVAAIKRPMWARMFLAGFFLWAAYLNSTLAIRSPGTYLTYATLNALPIYSRFINGFFAEHITVFVVTIAVGQFLITLGLMLNKIWVKLACIGGIIFGLAIAPLGVGSAFPATVCMAIAFFILLKKYDHDFIWKLKQYKTTLFIP